LGHALVKNDLGLVFGGGAVGLMGEIAKAVLTAGGEVIGVIPKDLEKKEVGFKDLADLRIVDSMHERKALIADLSDGFIALPGGLGTIEEIFEAITWTQLEIHRKPCGFLNTHQYFNHLIQFLDHMSEQHFVDRRHRDMIYIENDPDILLTKFKSFEYPDVDKSAWALRLMGN
jgi:uncharacterized protein (TIGR00730 family)